MMGPTTFSFPSLPVWRVWARTPAHIVGVHLVWEARPEGHHETSCGDAAGVFLCVGTRGRVTMSQAERGWPCVCCAKSEEAGRPGDRTISGPASYPSARP